MVLASAACKKLFENVISLYKIELSSSTSYIEKYTLEKYVGASFEYSLPGISQMCKWQIYPEVLKDQEI